MHLPARLRTILLAIAMVVVSFFVSLKAMDWIVPHSAPTAPVLAALPPLAPAHKLSVLGIGRGLRAAGAEYRSSGGHSGPDSPLEKRRGRAGIDPRGGIVCRQRSRHPPR